MRFACSFTPASHPPAAPAPASALRCLPGATARSRLLALALFIPLAGGRVEPVVAQQGAPAIHWWQGAAVAGGLTALMLLDEPMQRFIQGHRSGGLDDVAAGFRHFGQPEIYGTVTLGLLGAGLVSGNHALTRAGGRVAASVALAGATTGVAKLALGRPRPDQSLDADGFVPLSGQGSMPSGHTTAAFALATSLADDIHRPWATVGLYTMAGAVGWSRLNDDRHWFSDLVGGAAIGITSAKLVSGRWRIFHLHPPAVLIGSSGAAFGFTLSLPHLSSLAESP